MVKLLSSKQKLSVQVRLAIEVVLLSPLLISGNCTGLINLNNKRKMFIDFMFINYKEGYVCWYDGLSCKLNSIVLSKVL